MSVSPASAGLRPTTSFAVSFAGGFACVPLSWLSMMTTNTTTIEKPSAELDNLDLCAGMLTSSLFVCVGRGV
ncbi:MAG TPA: hypothetical protein VF668_06090 [Pyrinomonadaceae bacterium]|jgi:hypothetical protein